METRSSLNNRKPKKVKKKRSKAWLVILLTLLVFAGVVVGGVVLFARHIVSNQATNIVTSMIPSQVDASGQNLADIQLEPSTPQEISQHLNAASSAIVERAGGFLNSATATATDSSVTYDVSLGAAAANPLLVNGLLATNGDQIEEIANRVLDSMQASGVENPTLTLNLTDDDGNIIRTLHYSR